MTATCTTSPATPCAAGARAGPSTSANAVTVSLAEAEPLTGGIILQIIDG